MQLLCILVYDEADVAAFKDFVDDGTAAPTAQPKAAAAPAAPAPAPAPAAAPAPAPALTPTTPIPSMAGAPAAGVGGRLFASPLAKRLAAEQGLNLAVSIIYYKYCHDTGHNAGCATVEPAYYKSLL